MHVLSFNVNRLHVAADHPGRWQKGQCACVYVMVLRTVISHLASCGLASYVEERVHHSTGASRPPAATLDPPPRSPAWNSLMTSVTYLTHMSSMQPHLSPLSPSLDMYSFRPVFAAFFAVSPKMYQVSTDADGATRRITSRPIAHRAVHKAGR